MRDGFSTFLSTVFSLIWTLLLVGSAVVLGVWVTRELDVVVLSEWASLPQFLSVPLQRQGDNVIMTTLAGVMSGFGLLFLVGYVAQACLDALRLGWVTSSLKRKLKRLDDPKTLPVLQWKWFYYPLFTRLWREFAHSLIPASPLAKTRYQTTLPPEMVFSHQALVDVPMRVEFFRHLPGILTGSGIVSTFAGILMGLTGFDPAVEIENVTHELQGLFMGVSTAFTASFFAILIAILVTVVEKFLLHWRYAQVAALQGGLNRHFGMFAQEVGPGESSLSVDGPQMTAFLTRMETFLTLYQGEQEEIKAIRQVVTGLPEQAARWQKESVAQLAGVVATLTQCVESMTQRDAGYRDQMQQLMDRLSAVGMTLDLHLPRQLALMEAQSDWQNQLSGQMTSLTTLLGQWSELKNKSQETTGVWHAQVLQSVDRLQQEIGQLTIRIPAIQEIREVVGASTARLQQEIGQLATRIPAIQEIRDVVDESMIKTEGVLQQLAEQLATNHQEICSKVDLSGNGVSTDHTKELLVAFSQRLDGLGVWLQERLEGLSLQINQDREVFGGSLQALRVQMEQAAFADDEGMALLFAEMGKEMERLRRQIKDATGRITLQTQESLQALAGSLAPAQEGALVERLLDHATLQAEGVKQAVLSELDTTTKQMVMQMGQADEERQRLQEVSAQAVMTVIADRMERAFGGISEQLARMQEQLVTTQQTMEKSLQEWVMLVSKSTVEESKVLAKRIMEVQLHLDQRHEGVIGVIDQLGQGLEKDLEQLRDGLYHKNEESTLHVEHHLQELGQLLEGVVTSLGREQSVFIEMLGERLDSLRRRLKVK